MGKIESTRSAVSPADGELSELWFQEQPKMFLPESLLSYVFLRH